MNINDKRALLLSKIELLTLRAKKEQWCVHEDHCLMRLIFDYVVLDNWQKHIPKPAYKNMTNSQLDRALSLCTKMETCDKYFVDLLQFASLKWRDKL